jgi:hypothetical protein
LPDAVIQPFLCVQAGCLRLGRDEGTPPIFHEQRSLAERLYSDQGIDTRKLLGHRWQAMTDVYNSTRRLREWVTISLESKK